MAFIYRSFSIPFWAYGVPHAEEPCCLHEVGMRVDAGAFMAVPSGAAISDTMHALKQRIETFLQGAWAQRLLIGHGDARARAYARAHAAALPRSYVQLPCLLQPEALATYLLQRVFSSVGPSCRLDVRSLKVSLDPGGSFEARHGAGESPRTGECPQHSPQNEPIQARQTTKFPLRSPKQKKAGGKS